MATNGIAWKALPTELGSGSGATCWRRLRACHGAGAREKLHQAVPQKLGLEGLHGLVENVPGLGRRWGQKRGELTAPQPTNRGTLGRKYHLLVAADGLPLAVAITGTNRHGPMLVEPLLDGLAPVKGRGCGRPRRRPAKLHADKACAFRRVRRCLCRRGIPTCIARIGEDSGERLGRHRRVVERSIRWLLTSRRLALRHDRSATTITAVAILAITIMCARRLPWKVY